MPKLALQCLESWKKYCPAYELIRWDESNYDVSKNAYMRRAYEEQKWAFLTDYARLDIIYRYGGIYLDTDVELLRGLDDLLDCECYMGMEQAGAVNTGLGFGSTAGHAFLADNMREYEVRDFCSKGKFKPETCVRITSSLLRERGLVNENAIQTVSGVRIYPTSYFCPLKMGTNRLNITDQTYSIHHFAASWYTGSPFARKVKYYLIPLKGGVKKYILRKKE